MKQLFLFIIPLAFAMISCGPGNTKQSAEAKKSLPMDNNFQVRLITVDPGHFHASLVQKRMYPQISPDVHVYAPEGPDVQQHLGRINSYNSRTADPASWNEIVYTGPDFLEKMLAAKDGNVVVLSGNNKKKAEYITKSVNAGLNVLADKPMIIEPEDFDALKAAFRSAEEKGLLLYDIMTERFEITTQLQKLLAHREEIFGKMSAGTKAEPAVSKISVHHFSKMVSGSHLIRPAWFFDVRQQGEGIVDVTTHLVDLIQWECFPEQVLSPADVNMVSARRWPTLISKDEFKTVTGLSDFPEYLGRDVKDQKLNVFSNGEMVYQLKGMYAKVSVEWKFEAPAGGGDTHFSVMHGSQCDLVIRQGAETKFVPMLYAENIKVIPASEFREKLKNALASLPYDSLGIADAGKNSFIITIPQKLRVGHEEHFGQVTARFLEYLKAGKLPEWEVPGMITKYYTTTAALKLAKEGQK
jgi:predicted dehydrogenase